MAWLCFNKSAVEEQLSQNEVRALWSENESLAKQIKFLNEQLVAENLRHEDESRELKQKIAEYRREIYILRSGSVSNNINLPSNLASSSHQTGLIQSYDNNARKVTDDQNAGKALKSALQNSGVDYCSIYEKDSEISKEDDYKHVAPGIVRDGDETKDPNAVRRTVSKYANLASRPRPHSTGSTQEASGALKTTKNNNLEGTNPLALRRLSQSGSGKFNSKFVSLDGEEKVESSGRQQRVPKNDESDPVLTNDAQRQSMSKLFPILQGEEFKSNAENGYHDSQKIGSFDSLDRPPREPLASSTNNSNNNNNSSNNNNNTISERPLPRKSSGIGADMMQERINQSLMRSNQALVSNNAGHKTAGGGGGEGGISFGPTKIIDEEMKRRDAGVESGIDFGAAYPNKEDVNQPVTMTVERKVIAPQNTDADEVALELAMLLSQQDAEYQTNMIESIKPQYEIVISNYISQGFTREQASLMIFEEKYGKVSSQKPGGFIPSLPHIEQLHKGKENPYNNNNRTINSHHNNAAHQRNQNIQSSRPNSTDMNVVMRVGSYYEILKAHDDNKAVNISALTEENINNPIRGGTSGTNYNNNGEDDDDDTLSSVSDTVFISPEERMVKDLINRGYTRSHAKHVVQQYLIEQQQSLETKDMEFARNLSRLENMGMQPQVMSTNPHHPRSQSAPRAFSATGSSYNLNEYMEATPSQERYQKKASDDAYPHTPPRQRSGDAYDSRYRQTGDMRQNVDISGSAHKVTTTPVSYRAEEPSPRERSSRRNESRDSYENSRRERDREDRYSSKHRSRGHRNHRSHRSRRDPTYSAKERNGEKTRYHSDYAMNEESRRKPPPPTRDNGVPHASTYDATERNHQRGHELSMSNRTNYTTTERGRDEQYNRITNRDLNNSGAATKNNESPAYQTQRSDQHKNGVLSTSNNQSRYRNMYLSEQNYALPHVVSNDDSHRGRAHEAQNENILMNTIKPRVTAINETRGLNPLTDPVHNNTNSPAVTPRTAPPTTVSPSTTPTTPTNEILVPGVPQVEKHHGNDSNQEDCHHPPPSPRTDFATRPLPPTGRAV